ncbi:RagB/SusD family nutrient uptake outer membrane protein [Carboxylicivirga sediminis]|uniref:RagB/SusD family nutrient uptake outer membrane protein n=1 Tax=Carboxylicivirga sediminis TaxID=2006564 RepID=A0A941F3D4_9BACT|nr:RagB/SusD family nutrient uptake outer membrane protein [Carboxylicivirga sediminis]MBR8535607.1 RagB/SusD family nutrient uptake outer membrane protein [Carboxylicivirga sediminis]
MKPITKYIALFMGLILLSSCNDWLDIVQEGEVPSDEIDYTDSSLMYGPVSGVYATTRERLAQWEMWPLLNIRGDEVTKGGGSESDQGEYLYLEEFNYNQAKGFWALNNTWVSLYKIVFATHDNQELIENFREHLVSEEQLALADQYDAEIIFHRALAYYFISNLWGNAPIINPDDITYGIPYQPYRNSVESLRAYIYEELDFCIEHLPETQNDRKGAVTKYAAMALKAKVALMESDYNMVASLTDDIIEKAGLYLYDDYYNLFKVPGKLAPESLYELQFTDFDTGDGQQVYGGAWFQHQGPRNNPAPISGWGFMLLRPEFLDFMKGRNEEVRWDVAVLESGATTPAGDAIEIFEPNYMDIKAHYNGKAYLPKDQMTPGRNDYGSNNNIRVLRYADVLLMNAEAKLQIGGDVSTPFNEVRRRAGMDPISGITLDDILDERRAELSVEWGNRFFDLVRTGKAASVLDGFETGKHEYLPIPLFQEDLNPNLAGPIKDE